MKPEETVKENKFADVPLRVKTWVYIILAFALGISHPLATKIFVSWICFQAFFEFLRLFKVDRFRVLISAGIAIIQLLLLFNFEIEFYLLYSSFLIVNILVYFVIAKLPWRKIMGLLLGLIICLLSYSHLAFVRDSGAGIQSIIFLVVVTELNDVFQYLMGKFFGKHRIVPKISPNKTLEGLVGGIFLTVILSSVLGLFLLKSSITANLILGIMLGIFGFLGDVLMSYIKRQTGVKDTGNLLPGHGGLLDRMDSLIFNAPLFFWMLPIILKF